MTSTPLSRGSRRSISVTGWLVLAELSDGFRAVLGLAHNLKAIGNIEQGHQPLSHHVVVFHNQHANRFFSSDPADKSLMDVLS